ncbi:conserved hypothetical protein [Trichinella spiralis]|uniref:hypothetical protein n=1 Tax=Trichinella spiralis TaxID=6334 RepID=UPI0001EFD647|nr:conserved hypothetical protein [Trichinella spiralis]
MARSSTWSAKLNAENETAFDELINFSPPVSVPSSTELKPPVLELVEQNSIAERSSPTSGQLDNCNNAGWRRTANKSSWSIKQHWIHGEQHKNGGTKLVGV